MENNITSLEVSKKLRKAGFKKIDNEFFLVSLDGFKYKALSIIPAIRHHSIRAYQVNEILAELPRVLEKDKLIYCLDVDFNDKSIDIDYSYVDNMGGTHFLIQQEEWINKETFQDTLALMWIWLKENGYLKN